MLTNKKSRGDGDGGRRVRGDDGAEGGSVSHGEDDTHLKMLDAAVFCFSCPGCDEQVSNYRRGVLAITQG